MNNNYSKILDIKLRKTECKHMEIWGKACSHDKRRMKSHPQSFDSSEGYVTLLVPVCEAATLLVSAALFLFPGNLQ